MGQAPSLSNQPLIAPAVAAAPMEPVVLVIQPPVCALVLPLLLPMHQLVVQIVPVSVEVVIRFMLRVEPIMRVVMTLFDASMQLLVWVISVPAISAVPASNRDAEFHRRLFVAMRLRRPRSPSHRHDRCSGGQQLPSLTKSRIHCTLPFAQPHT